MTGCNFAVFFVSLILFICKDWEEPEFLIVLAEEELVAIDLTQDDWPCLTPPYLASPHTSAITCSSHVEGLSDAVWEKICEAAKGSKSSKSNSVRLLLKLLSRFYVGYTTRFLNNVDCALDLFVLCGRCVGFSMLSFLGSRNLDVFS